MKRIYHKLNRVSRLFIRIDCRERWPSSLRNIKRWC